VTVAKLWPRCGQGAGNTGVPRPPSAVLNRRDKLACESVSWAAPYIC
jgi:hypothetical protein